MRRIALPALACAALLAAPYIASAKKGGNGRLTAQERSELLADVVQVLKADHIGPAHNVEALITSEAKVLELWEREPVPSPHVVTLIAAEGPFKNVCNTSPSTTGTTTGSIYTTTGATTTGAPTTGTTGTTTGTTGASARPRCAHPQTYSELEMTVPIGEAPRPLSPASVQTLLDRLRFTNLPAKLKQLGVPARLTTLAKR